MTGATRGPLSVDARRDRPDAAALRAAAGSTWTRPIEHCPDGRWPTCSGTCRARPVVLGEIVVRGLADPDDVRRRATTRHPHPPDDELLAGSLPSQRRARWSRCCAPPTRPRRAGPGRPSSRMRVRACATRCRRPPCTAGTPSMPPVRPSRSTRLAAVDAIEEFLTVSVGSTAWPAEGAAPLGVPLVLRCHRRR